MKNLLLIFFLGFALFWVGCEKEEIVFPEVPVEVQDEQLLNEGVISHSMTAKEDKVAEQPPCCD